MDEYNVYEDCYKKELELLYEAHADQKYVLEHWDTHIKLFPDAVYEDEVKELERIKNEILKRGGVV